MKDLGFVLWICGTITALAVVFHISFIKEYIPLSECHNAEIKIYHDRPMCTECKLYCEVRK
tara:strand:- start:822 stop:1004 length:183 start_codon:yes stop_codon:yes gene_type:complete